MVLKVIKTPLSLRLKAAYFCKHYRENIFLREFNIPFLTVRKLAKTSRKFFNIENFSKFTTKIHCY